MARLVAKMIILRHGMSSKLLEAMATLGMVLLLLVVVSMQVLASMPLEDVGAIMVMLVAEDIVVWGEAALVAMVVMDVQLLLGEEQILLEVLEAGMVMLVRCLVRAMEVCWQLVRVGLT